MNEIHCFRAVIILDDFSSTLRELKLVPNGRVKVGPMNQIVQTVGIRVMRVGEGNQSAHDVARVSADERWNSTESMQHDVGDVERSENRDVGQMQVIEQWYLTEDRETEGDLITPRLLLVCRGVQDGASA